MSLGSFEIHTHGTSKDLIREMSRKVVSMNNRYAMFLKSISADSAARKRGNHLLRIIIESRFILLANLQAPGLASNHSLYWAIGRILRTVSPLNRLRAISAILVKFFLENIFLENVFKFISLYINFLTAYANFYI